MIHVSITPNLEKSLPYLLIKNALEQLIPKWVKNWLGDAVNLSERHRFNNWQVRGPQTAMIMHPAVIHHIKMEIKPDSSILLSVTHEITWRKVLLVLRAVKHKP